MTRSRTHTIKLLKLLVAVVLIWSTISGWLAPLSKGAAEWAIPQLLAASQRFGRIIVSLLIRRG
jgi:hypothetical protein